MSRIKSTRFDVAKRMPPLRKRPDRETPYDPARDEVRAWAAQQPELINYLVDRIRHSSNVTCDPETGYWKGVDWK